MVTICVRLHVSVLVCHKNPVCGRSIAQWINASFFYYWLFILFYNDRFTSYLNNASTWGFKLQSVQVNLSFQYCHPHIFHEIVDPSIHWLPAFKPQLLLLLFITIWLKCDYVIDHNAVHPRTIFVCTNYCMRTSDGFREEGVKNKKTTIFRPKYGLECVIWGLRF